MSFPAAVAEMNEDNYTAVLVRPSSVQHRALMSRMLMGLTMELQLLGVA